MAEIRDIDKIKESREQSTYSFFFMLTAVLLAFFFGIIIGVHFSEGFKEIFSTFSLTQ